ncbi:MAG: C45 family peptidase [Bacillota bacterium]|nr:C45 family peptidase [Bacillota bacterium]
MYPHFTLSGTPYEIGLKHGSLAKELVIRNITGYEKLFRDLNGLSWDSVINEAINYIPAIKKFDEDLIEEMKGLADGAGVDFNSILALNCRSELIMNSKMIDAIGGCTSFGIMPEKTSGSTYMGQNWDFFESQKDVIIVLEIDQANKPKILMITEAGIIGKIGINSNGLAVCLNALVTEQVTDGTPLHLVLRGILNAPNLNAAVATAQGSEIASACNFLIGQQGVTVISMEMIPDDFEIIFPDEGTIIHTNHILSDRLDRKVVDLGRGFGFSTFFRLQRAKKLYGEVSEHDLDSIMALQSDHVNFPNSICAHMDPDKPQSMRTIFSVIFDLETCSLYLSSGYPCESEYKNISFID